MPQIFNRNAMPAYYALPAAFMATIGAAAITAFPQPASAAALQALTGVQASLTLAFAGQPGTGASSTITINGVPITFVAAGSGGFSLLGQKLSGTILSSAGVPMPYQAVGPYGLQCELGATLYATLLNLVGLCRSWPDEALSAVHLRVRGGNTLQVSAAATGTAGNGIAVATGTGSNAAVTPAGGSTTAANTAANTTLAGGAAPTAGYAVLVEPQPHPVELSGAWMVCRGYLSGTPTTNAAQAAGTMTLFFSDGAVARKGTATTFAAGNTLSSTQEMAAIPVVLNPSGITPAGAGTPTLVVPPWTGLYAYGGTTQVIDIIAAPAGSY